MGPKDAWEHAQIRGTSVVQAVKRRNRWNHRKERDSRTKRRKRPKKKKTDKKEEGRKNEASSCPKQKVFSFDLKTQKLKTMAARSSPLLCSM
jgi:hypothetical protein